MLKKSWIILLVAAALAVSFAAAEENTVKIVLSDDGLAQETDGVTFYEGVVTIFKPGTYELSGSLTDGQVYVNCADDGKVILVLNGVSINSETSAGLQIGKCKPGVELTLAEGTENVISCGPGAIPDPEEDRPLRHPHRDPRGFRILLCGVGRGRQKNGAALGRPVSLFSCKSVRPARWHPSGKRRRRYRSRRTRWGQSCRCRRRRWLPSGIHQCRCRKQRSFQ